MARQKFMMMRKRRGSAAPMPPPSGDGLWDRFTGAGGVRMDSVGGGKWGFAKHAWEFDPSSGTFLGSGSTYQARFTVPAPQPIGTSASGLPFATIVSTGTDPEGFADIADGQRNVGCNYTGHYIGGMIADENDCWWLHEPHYNTTTGSDPVLGRSDNDFALTTLNGNQAWKTNVHYKRICTYGCVIPQAFADAHLGGRRLLLGAGPVSGHQQSSWGPAATAVEVPSKPYDPAQVLTTKTMLFYTQEHPAKASNGNAWPGPSGTVYNVVWIEDGAENWLIFVCGVGHGSGYYGNAADYPYYNHPIREAQGTPRGAWDADTQYVVDDLATEPDSAGRIITYIATANSLGVQPPNTSFWERITRDPYNIHRGYHAPPYHTELHIYNVADLMGVIGGTEDSWTPQPREIIDVSSLLFQGAEYRRDHTAESPRLSQAYFGRNLRALSLMWVPAAKRLWLMESKGDWTQGGETQPVLHAFDLDGGA